MTTITGQLPYKISENATPNIEQLLTGVSCSQDGTFVLDLKKANIKTPCLYGRCRTFCINTYCDDHKAASRNWSNNNYANRKKRALSTGICISPACEATVHITDGGKKRLLCEAHLLKQRQRASNRVSKHRQKTFLQRIKNDPACRF